MMTEEECIEIAESDMCDSDDSQEDPSFDILEETQSRFSGLSVKKKSKSRINKDAVEDDIDAMEMTVPEFSEKDQKIFEIVQKIIEVGQVETLKVEQCKLYLRKHGLRLTGKKDVLIDRIKEHLSIINGGGEDKYPASSFVINCKGDACTGDIVMFEQNVYELFSIASRSATGPPCGTRVVAGRIVKESYGAAKQQHTFTIEVLWSKGVKPLPPLHPLLIKGRNLYRLKTMRQRWEDEGQRQKILLEKHARGTAARTNRDARIQEKEVKKALRESRISKKNVQNKEHEEKKRKTSPARIQAVNQPISSFPHAKFPFEAASSSQRLTGMIHNHGDKENTNFYSLGNPMREGPMEMRKVYFNPSNGPLRRRIFQVRQNTAFYHPPNRFQGHNYVVRENFYHLQSPSSDNFRGNDIHIPRSHSGQGHGQKQQLCKYYAQGKCHYGTNCKYLHEGASRGYVAFQ